MELARRVLLCGCGRLVAQGAVSSAFAQPGAARFPRKKDLAILPGHAYVNGAYIHPMPVGTQSRSRPDAEPWECIDIKSEFAALINAKPSESEIAYVPRVLRL